MSQKQLSLIEQSLFDETCYIKDLKGITYEVRIYSILGFNKYYPFIPARTNKEDLDFKQFYSTTTGKPVYEIHLPECIIYVDKVTSDRIEILYEAHNNRLKQVANA